MDSLQKLKQALELIKEARQEIPGLQKPYYTLMWEIDSIEDYREQRKKWTLRSSSRFRNLRS